MNPDVEYHHRVTVERELIEIRSYLHQINEHLKEANILKQLNGLITQLKDALEDAENHLDFTGYGDSYERDCARQERLPEKIQEAIKAAEAHLNGKD